jgi:hypothetical protein
MWLGGKPLACQRATVTSAVTASGFSDASSTGASSGFCDASCINASSGYASGHSTVYSGPSCTGAPTPSHQSEGPQFRG